MAPRKRGALGHQIRQRRRAAGLSLQQLGSRTGISLSTLSKIENDLMDLTFARLTVISEALGVNLTDLVSTAGAAGPELVTARRSIASADSGFRMKTRNYVYEYLHTEIARKQMIPSVGVITARTPAEYGEFSQHSGEEFILVLDGEIELHTEHYSPTRLREGDSAYLDSTMPHALVSTSPEFARILFVCTHAIPDGGFEPPAKVAHHATESKPAAASRSRAITRPRTRRRRTARAAK